MSTRNARFQQWQALLSNRTKRQRAGEFLVHGVRPITSAVERGWPVRALLYDAERTLSRWADGLLGTVSANQVPAVQVAMAPELLHELGDKADEVPELLAVVGIPDDDLDRVPVGPDFLGVLFDRPASPGNIGTVIRSADAFGASGVIITGHAADLYDPKAVRAATGSLFAIPSVRAPSHREVMAWVDAHRARGVPIRVVGTDEGGAAALWDCDLTRPTLLLVGNETTGLSATWREHCDQVMSIPMVGSASSLNAAAAATSVLYESTRQRSAR